MSNIAITTKNSASLILLDIVDVLRLKNEKIEIIEIDNGSNRSASFNVKVPGETVCTLMSYLFKNPHWNSPLRRINPNCRTGLDGLKIFDFRLSNFKNAIRKVSNEDNRIFKISNSRYPQGEAVILPKSVFDDLLINGYQLQCYSDTFGPGGLTIMICKNGKTESTLFNYMLDSNEHILNNTLINLLTEPVRTNSGMFEGFLYDFTVSNIKNCELKSKFWCSTDNKDKISHLLQCTTDEIDTSSVTFDDIINETIGLLVDTSNHFNKSFDEVIHELSSKLNNFSNNTIHQQITEQEKILNKHIDEFHTIVGNLKSQLK